MKRDLPERSRSGREVARVRRDDHAVTIDSDSVHIVNDLSMDHWDVQSTLIEVDGNALTQLIFNCRHLIFRSGRDLAPEEAQTLLDTMIEDACRLCARSPTL